MSNQTWMETLVTAIGDQTAVNTSTSDVSMLGTGVGGASTAANAATYTIPANYFYIGKQLLVRCQGRISSFTSGTLTISFSLGTLATPIKVFGSGAITLVASQTNQTFDMEILLTCRAIGSGTTANFMGIGKLQASSAILANGNVLLPATAPAVGTGFDSTIANVANLLGTWSVSSASNSIQVHNYALISMN